VVTLISWYVAGFLITIPFTLLAGNVLAQVNTVIIIINVVAGVNMIILGLLKDKY
jgi:hypothetical protein